MFQTNLVELEAYRVDYVEALHHRLCQLLNEQAGAQLDALYFTVLTSALQEGEFSQNLAAGQLGVMAETKYRNARSSCLGTRFGSEP